EDEVELRDGWAIAADIPAAAFGTLAIFAREENAVVDIVGGGPGEKVEFNDIDSPDTLDARIDRLRASLHVPMRLEYKQDGVDAAAQGTLKHVGEEYAILEAERTTLAVPLAEIRSMKFTDAPMRIHVVEDGKSRKGSVTLVRAYLTRGMTWVPEYTM